MCFCPLCVPCVSVSLYLGKRLPRRIPSNQPIPLPSHRTTDGFLTFLFSPVIIFVGIDKVCVSFGTVPRAN